MSLLKSPKPADISFRVGLQQLSFTLPVSSISLASCSACSNSLSFPIISSCFRCLVCSTTQAGIWRFSLLACYLADLSRPLLAYWNRFLLSLSTLSKNLRLESRSHDIDPQIKDNVFPYGHVRSRHISLEIGYGEVNSYGSYKQRQGENTISNVGSFPI